MRTTVTVEDRRLALFAARAPRPMNQRTVPAEAFIRRWLKNHMGIPATTPASASIRTAARELAAVTLNKN